MEGVYLEVVKEVVGLTTVLALLRSFWVAVVVASDFACAELLMPLSPRQVLLFVVELVSVAGCPQCRNAALAPVVAQADAQRLDAFARSQHCVLLERALTLLPQLVVLPVASAPELLLLVPLPSVQRR